ncbi:MAG: glycosyltransferase family 9 protein [Bacteriovoracia bacterium]
MKILLAKRRALGDTVLLGSTVELLKKSFPAAEVSVLVPAAFAPVLEGHPGIAKIYRFEDGFFSNMGRLRAEKFDYFFQLHASPQTRWLAWASGAGQVLFHYQNNETEKAYGKHPNALEWDACFLRSVFGEQISVPAHTPRIYLSVAEAAEGARFWKKWGLEGKQVILFGLGASRATKRWPAAHFARLAELLRDRLDLYPAFITGPGEEEALFAGKVLDELRAKGLRAIPEGGGKGDFIHAVGLSVRDLAKASSAVRAYAGNDSGPKHIAVAVGTPTFTFFGPEDPVEWHPYSTEEHPVFFIPKLHCRAEDNGRWCGIAECVEEKHRCMADLDPLDAYHAIETKVGGFHV